MAAVDDYNYSGIAASLDNVRSVTTSDANDLAHVSRAVLVGTAGDLKVTDKNGNTDVLTNVPVGWHPIRVSRIWATGTTASDISYGW